jgi:hypothetical protein
MVETNSSTSCFKGYYVPETRLRASREAITIHFVTPDQILEGADAIFLHVASFQQIESLPSVFHPLLCTRMRRPVLNRPGTTARFQLTHKLNPNAMSTKNSSLSSCSLG